MEDNVAELTEGAFGTATLIFTIFFIVVVVISGAICVAVAWVFIKRRRGGPQGQQVYYPNASARGYGGEAYGVVPYQTQSTPFYGGGGGYY